MGKTSTVLSLVLAVVLSVVTANWWNQPPKKDVVTTVSPESSPKKQDSDAQKKGDVLPDALVIAKRERDEAVSLVKRQKDDEVAAAKREKENGIAAVNRQKDEMVIRVRQEEREKYLLLKAEKDAEKALEEKEKMYRKEVKEDFNAIRKIVRQNREFNSEIESQIRRVLDFRQADFEFRLTLASNLEIERIEKMSDKLTESDIQKRHEALEESITKRWESFRKGQERFERNLRASVRRNESWNNLQKR